MATAAAGAFSVLISWYYRPYFGAANQNLGLPESSPLAGGLFDLRGIAFAAWTLAAFRMAGPPPPDLTGDERMSGRWAGPAVASRHMASPLARVGCASPSSSPAPTFWCREVNLSARLCVKLVAARAGCRQTLRVRPLSGCGPSVMSSAVYCSSAVAASRYDRRYEGGGRAGL
jgi:hypothetical protein